MKGFGFAALLIALSPLPIRAQDYTNATNAAWCVGAIGTQIDYYRAYEVGAAPNYKAAIGQKIAALERAQALHRAFAFGYLGGDKIVTMLGFINFGKIGAAQCKPVTDRCAIEHPYSVEDWQRQSAQWAAYRSCYSASLDCKRVSACIDE